MLTKIKICTVVFIAILVLVGSNVKASSNIVIKDYPDEFNSELKLFIEYNNDNLIGIKEGGGIYGPESFCVRDNKIYIGNIYKYNILVFENEELLDTINYSSNINLVDICVNEHNIYILSKYYSNENSCVMFEIYCIDFKGNTLASEKVPNIVPLRHSGQSDIEWISLYQGDLVLMYRNGGIYAIDENLQETKEISSVKTVLNDENETIIEILDEKIAVTSEMDMIKVVDFNDKNIYFYGYKIDHIEKNNIMILEKTLFIYNIKDNIVENKIVLLEQDGYYWSEEVCSVTSTGDIYQMLFDKYNNMYIYKIDKNIEYVSLNDKYINMFSEYKVVKGDTIFEIAKKYNISPNYLAIYNDVNDIDYIEVDQYLKIPTYSIFEGLKGRTIQVQKGESISIIAKKEGCSINEIMEYNFINYSSILEINQILYIPQ